MAQAVANYFAQVGIRVDQTSLKAVDQYFKTLESKFKFYSGRFGQGLTLKVNFQANIRDLIRGIQAKLDPKGNGVGVRIRITPRIAQTDIAALRRQLRGGLANIPVTVRYSGNLRQSLMNRINQAIAPARAPRSPSGGSTRGSSGGGGGRGGSNLPNLSTGVLGRTLRFGAGGLPFVGGAIGFNQLNQANTDYQSQKLAAEGIFAGKLPGGGSAARQQLYNLAQLNGFDYKATLPNFTRFMASAMPSLGYGGAFGSFRSITEFGRARGATGESMERALYAFSQIAGKGKVMSEELFGQLSEAAGFGESGDIFAQAYAEKSKSGLTGQKAQAALREAMKEGKVLSSDILPIVARIMSERAAPTLERARGTADANQMRFRNARRKFMERFSDSGGEAGFAKFWDAAGKAMEKLADRAPQLAQTFESLVDNAVKLGKVFSDISETLLGGYGTESTIAIQRETGINIVAIRDSIAAVASVLAKIGEALGVGGSIAAIAGVYGAKKLLGAWVGNKVGGVVDKVTGNAGSLAFFAHGNALRVFVVNNGGGGFDASTGAGQHGNRSNNRRGSKLGKAATTIGFATAALANILPGFIDDPLWQSFAYTGAMMLDGAIAGGIATKNPWGAAAGAIGGFGLGLATYGDGWADSFKNRNISDAAPVVQQAAATESYLKQDFMLKADINITAQTGQEALDVFAREMESKVFAPFMRQSLQEAQSTTSIYAR